MLNNQKFESSMFDYCSEQAERAYKLLEDGDSENSLQILGHLADILQLLVESKNTQGVVSIGNFANSIKELSEDDKDQIYTHFQGAGFGQYIPE
jgi:flagellin-specific chaperone FliS